MAQFSRRTILAATDIAAEWGHTEIDRFLLEYGLEDRVGGTSRADRANSLGRYLIQNPNRLSEDGENLSDAIVTALVTGAANRCFAGYPAEFQIDDFAQRFSSLHRGLGRDGFTVDTGQLRRALPDAIDLPRADDEVHDLLRQYGFVVSNGHLDQGIAAHARGDWAAANAQFRAFIESLFDAIAARLSAGGVPPAPGYPSRLWLANRVPPFLMTALNEWTGDGKGFFEAFFRRLHPAGAHPGLSDEEDSTFRLHLVLLIGRHLLRRIGQI